MTNVQLRYLRTSLKNGEYDGVDIMNAWIVIDELIDLRKQHEALKADAERYRKITNLTKGKQFEGGQQAFDYPHFEPLNNLFKGSVAGHLDQAIDKARAK